MSEPQEEPRVRIDKWLWAARFFKTRALASAAVDGGKVHVNGERVKPSRQIRCGDEMRIQKGADTFVIEVQALSSQRGPAERAQTLYREHESSIVARQTLRDERRLQIAAEPVPGGRPDKRSRRQWQRLQGR
jgi:ribosome-associated heat shock protein Hsp15